MLAKKKKTYIKYLVFPLFLFNMHLKRFQHIKLQAVKIFWILPKPGELF